MPIILQLLLHILFLLVIAVSFSLLERFTGFSKWNKYLKQSITGVAFGITAILSSLYGIDAGDGILVNVRDASPLISGLVFGPISGLISGLIGGIHRLLMAGYTQLACGIGTMVAGIFGAGTRHFIFKKKPNVFYAGLTGLIVEDFHMLLVFFTHMDDIKKCFSIIETCSVPMISCVTIGVMTGVGLCSLISNDYEKVDFRLKTISTKYLKNISLVILGAFLLTSTFNYYIQDQLSLSNGENKLENAILDLESDIENNYKKGEIINKNDFEEKIKHICDYRRIGDHGFLMIADNEYNVIANEISHVEKNLNDLPFGYDFVEEEGITRRSFEGVEFIIKTVKVDDYYLIACLPNAEIIESRDVSIYITSLLQIMVYSLLLGNIFFLSKRHVTNKVEIINDALNSLSAGKVIEKLDVRGSSEFESLSANINGAIDFLKQANERENEKLLKDLEFARNIQLSALPNADTEFIGDDRFELSATMKPAVEVGGDFYDFYFVGKDHFVITIADVSGKSFPAAMFMMESKAIIKGLVQKGLKASEAITQANSELCASNSAGMFLTLFMAIIDLKTGDVDIANAGHNPQLVGKNEFEYLKLNTGFVLAGFPNFKYQELTYHLKPGDTFVLYTDGITEALNQNHELYGEDRLLEYLNNNFEKNTKELCFGIIDDVEKYADGAPQADDETVLVFKYNGIIRKKAITVDATIPNIEVVTKYANDILSEYSVDKKVIGQINIAIDELFGNIAKYAYKGKVGKASLVVEVDEKKNECSITFIDQGIRYNPLDLEDPDTELPLEQRDIGGLGIYMVKNFLDDVTYEYKNHCNILKITKSLK